MTFRGKEIPRITKHKQMHYHHTALQPHDKTQQNIEGTQLTNTHVVDSTPRHCHPVAATGNS